MRAELREILTDINAAMRIQHPESIIVALDKILDLPEVTGNQVLEDVSISSSVANSTYSSCASSLKSSSLDFDILSFNCENIKCQN